MMSRHFSRRQVRRLPYLFSVAPETLQQSLEPALREMLSTLLKDEVRHAAAGRSLALRLAQHFGRDRLVDGKDLPAIVASDVALIRATYRDSATDGPARDLGASLREDELPDPFDYAPWSALWTRGAATV